MLRAETDLEGLAYLIDRHELRLLGTEPCSAEELCRLCTALYRGDAVGPLQLQEADNNENIMFLRSGLQQQQLTALVAVIIRGEPVDENQAELYFNLEHDDEQETFVAATPGLELVTQWVKVADVLRTESDRPFLKHAGLTRIDDPRFDKYTQRLARLRAIRNYTYSIEIERGSSRRLA